MENQSASLRKRISRRKAILFSIIPLLLLLIVGEFTLRAWAYYFRTSYERYNYATGRLELVPNTHFTSEVGREILINSRGFVGPEFEERKQEGTFRIFALGDSCTFGGSWKEAYPAVLQGLLNSATLKHRVEVINAGIEGYNSEYALARLKEELLPYSPDMVIVYIGWNDLMKVNPNNLSSTGKYPWAASLMERSYLMKGLSKLMFFYLRPALMTPGIEADQSGSHVFDGFVPMTYRENLTAIVEILRKRGIAVLLVTLPTAVQPHMSIQELKARDIFFPYYAGAYSVDKFLSLHRSYNSVIRSVASERNVTLVDLDLIFNGYDKKGLFWDTMHPSAEGHILLAQSLLGRVIGIISQSNKQLDQTT